MLNINAKKINLILLSITTAFVIIFSNFYVYAEDNETETETNKEIDSQISEYDDDIYSIEAIVYNKVPFLDINVFSDTSAGVKMPDNSIESVLKRTVAIWYVSLRNISFVIFAILLIYSGMMMAISTVAEEKATYKKRLIGWLKGIIVAAFIHYIIYIVIMLNQNIVNTIAQTSGKELQIYNTIKTRAMDARPSIGIPATIFYITLVIMWLRFLWTYIKRKFNVEFLIILAPLVVAKYTYELTGGKKSKILFNWFQRFTTAVFIQSIHALFYTIFVSTILELSTTNLTGFILSLMTLNFMLSADKLFTNIFKFNFSGKDIDDLNRPFKLKEDLGDVFIAYSVAKRTIPAIQTAGRTIQTEASIGYNKAMDKLDEKNGKDNRAIIKNKLNAPKEKAENWILDKIDTKDKEHKNPINNKIRRAIILKKMSRTSGETKEFAKRTIKMKHKTTIKKFKSNYKFIKDIALGGAEAILAIPLGVNYGADVGLTTGFKSLNNITDATKLGSKENKEKEKSHYKKIDDAVKSVETVHDETNKISDEIDKLSEEDKKEIRENIKKYNKLGMDKYKIKKTIQKDLKLTNNEQIEEKDIEKIINKVEDKLPDNISEEEKSNIKNNAINTIKDKKNNSGESKNNDGNNSKNLYTTDEIIEGINNAIIKYSFGEKYENIGKSVEKISSTNSREVAKKNSLGKLIDINKFVDTL
jgi:hypothetical protein